MDQERKSNVIRDREDAYKARRLNQMISPARQDPFLDGDQTPSLATYTDIMQEKFLSEEERNLRNQMSELAKKGELKARSTNGSAAAATVDKSAAIDEAVAAAPPTKRRRRWDLKTSDATPSSAADAADSTPGASANAIGSGMTAVTPKSAGLAPTPLHPNSATTPRSSQWDETPGRLGSSANKIDPKQWAETPAYSVLTSSAAASSGGPMAEGVGLGGATPSARQANAWEDTPRTDRIGGATSDTPAHLSSGGGGGLAEWAETPRADRTPGNLIEDSTRITAGDMATPLSSSATAKSAAAGNAPNTVSHRRSRWDETPMSKLQQQQNTPQSVGGGGGGDGVFTPSARTGGTAAAGGGVTPIFTPGGSTPIGLKAAGFATPAPGAAAAGGLGGVGGAAMPMTPDYIQAVNWQREIDERNRHLTDEELDVLLPPGYRIAVMPSNYVPVKTPGQRILSTPTPLTAAAGGTPLSGTTPGNDAFRIGTPESNARAAAGIQKFGANNAGLGDLQPNNPNLPLLRPDDMNFFEKLLEDVDEDSLPPEEQRERRIMKLLLKIKNGTPPMRKSAMRQIIEKAREFGPGPLLNQILPLLMTPSLEDQERHFLVKTIDRILYKLDEQVRPYVHKILVVIEPLLIDEDYYARVEGREIISNLAKAAGLASMISTMRPDIDNIDEYVRNTTARAFAVVASALKIPKLLPFLKAVCRSKKSWQARHTGIKIIQQIAILMGCAILPHLRPLVEIIEHGLSDEQQKVRTITALALAALAEAATPYGIESFDSVLKPLWKGIRTHRGKGLAAFLKAIGYLIPLMDAEYARCYTKEVMLILIREFQSPDGEMKKIVLKVVKQCCATEGVEPDYIRSDILPPFFRHFWNQRMAVDRRNYKQLVETTVEIAIKVGVVDIVSRIKNDLKDESEQYRKMVMETIERIISTQGTDEIDGQLEQQLIDGVVYAFQEQSSEDQVMLNGFGSIVQALGRRTKPYLSQFCGIILWRLQNKSAKVRQQIADLIAKIAPVMKICQEEKLLTYLGKVLYEYLGEEYPEVLGSILGALKVIVTVVGMNKMTPPIKELLPRLTPILKNRQEKVQENCIDLVGRIADRGHESVPTREWMRICIELLELIKANKKSIRRATVNTFGYIANAIGPHDVLGTLLQNLKVQERQNRVCTTVAIAIVAETCRPFTVLPGLMNEYRVPELNVQNGVLKSLSFMFEYIGEMGKDYIYAVLPLLEDALMDRDLVHRQTAMSAVAHMTLGVFGFGCEDALVHLLNYVWPNIFETSPHIVQAFILCIEAMRVSLGPSVVLSYCLQGLYHPARRVRDMMWKVYNTIYIGHQDGITYGFPRIPDEKWQDGTAINIYTRHELDYLI